MKKTLLALGCQGGSRVLENFYRERGRTLIKVLGAVPQSGRDPALQRWKGPVWLVEHGGW